MNSSTFRFRIKVPRRVDIPADDHPTGFFTLEREAFYAWLWEALSPQGLMGVHEGTLLSEDAQEAGLEPGSWTLDAGEAPRERDWVSNQELTEGELYFATEGGAHEALEVLRGLTGLVLSEQVEEQKPQDWDAQWKASFTGSKVPPFWQVLPPWVEPDAEGMAAGERVLRVNPGAGFGTGTHETTQLCLEVLGRYFPDLSDKRVLDFGSGSGILSIGAALLGAREVLGVEIDPLAVDNAVENAELNQLSDRVKFSKTLDAAQGRFEIVLANILKPVLLEFAPELIKRLAPGGTVILSGLMSGTGLNDVDAVSERYSALLERPAPQVLSLNEWRALVWRP